MEPTGHPGLVTSTDINTPGNLDILAQTAASQSTDDPGGYSGGFPVLKISENANIPLQLLSQHIRIEGQPGGPMLSQAQLHKILNSADPDKGLSPGPLSIITTTSVNDPGQTSPASLAHGGLQYRSAGASGDAMLSAINYNENEILQESAFEVGSNLGNLDDGLLSGIGNPSRLGENPAGETYGLFDEEGDALNMEALSPQGLLIADTGSLGSVSVSETGDSGVGDTLHSGDDKKKGKARSKNGKGQISPGKGGPVECNQCHKSFNNTSALAKHKLTHSDERKFLCTICDKKFKRQDHLNGHLMTHRDKKPYQCMVSGCEKSYCDARSLKRHLENHHQHTSDQIAAEMVAAASQAADILAEASSAQQPAIVTQKGPQMSQAAIGSMLHSSSSDSVIQNTPAAVEGQTQIQQVAMTALKAEPPNSILGQQLMINPAALNQSGAALVTLAVNLPTGGDEVGQDVAANPQTQVVSIAQYEALFKQEQLQQQQMQFLQEQMKQDSDPVKIDPEHLEAFRQMQLKGMEMQAIAAAAQLQQEQHQQQQQKHHHPVVSGASPTSNWQSHQSSNIQSPGSSEMSPGYSELSPINHGQPGSPGRSQAQMWLGQSQHGVPAPNTTVADVKVGEDPSKPVVCSICQRRFKNVPALNGHMRLHGGYFKKETALKEEKKKKADMAPPSGVPSRGAGASVGSPQNGGNNKKNKGTPPMQSPPSEELHQLHWQQKQEQQQLQQLQLQQQHQYQQQPQQQVAKLPQQQPSASQTVHEHLKQIKQKLEQQQQQQQLQQQQHLQQQIQAQLEQQQQQQQQTIAQLGQVGSQLSQQAVAQLSQLELIQLAQLQEGGVDPQQIEHIKMQLAQQHIQQQLQQQQESQQQQMIYDNPGHGQQQMSSQDLQFNSPQHVPLSPHLPTSPQYTHPHSVPQSPQVPQSPLLQRQGSVEPLQSPVPEYSSQGIPIIQETIGLASRFADQGMPDYGGMQDGSEGALLHNIQQQIQMQSQNIHVNSLQHSGNINMQTAHLGSMHNPSLPNSASIDMNNQLQQQQQMDYNQSVNLQHDQNSFQSQISGRFRVGEELVPSDVPVPAMGGSHTTSEIVSQIITSLENLGEVPPGSMHQISKSDSGLPQLTERVFSPEHMSQYQQQPMAVGENGMNNNSLNEFAQNTVVHNQGVSSSFNSPYSSQPQVTESRVKQELLKHLASKPSSPRAAQAVQFSFHNNNNSVNSNNNNNGIGGATSQRQRHHSAKADLNASTAVSKPQQANTNSELKRRLSAGPEDIRSPLLSHPSAPDLLSRTYIKPAPRSDENTKPRLRSKSGDDYRLQQRWRNEDHFMKPKIRTEDGAHRPRSKTNEHLAKWSNSDVFSRSDGAGVFRNPSSMTPLKMRRKNRPAPLIIPSQYMCGFQSRLRSPRVVDGENGCKTAPVPYTPPPMLSPLRRGSGLFSNLPPIPGFTPQPLVIAGSISTPRPSLLRTASVQKIEKVDEVCDDTVPFVEEQPPPESDVHPHVNIGPQYQAALPEFNPHKKMAVHDESKEDLVFHPSCLQEVSVDDVQSFQDLACSSAVSGNGCNVEHALHLLHVAEGNIQRAMLMLMSGDCKLSKNHSLTSYTYQESDVWVSDEIDAYTQAILKVDKDFFSVANMVKTKSVRQCVQFYYLWKKVLVDEHKRLRAIRRRREQDYNLRSTRGVVQQGEGPVAVVVTDGGGKVGVVVEEAGDEGEARDLTGDEEDSLSEASTSVGTFDDHNEKDLESEEMDISVPAPVLVIDHPVRVVSPVTFSCDYAECRSKFSSKAALNGHMKLHQKVTKPVAAPTVNVFERKASPTPPTRSPVHQSEPPQDSFPCKLCGRVFAKVKSRSAHMKIHRPDQDKEKEKKAKLAKQQAAAAAAAASLEQPMYSNYSGFGNMPNGPSQL